MLSTAVSSTAPTVLSAGRTEIVSFYGDPMAFLRNSRKSLQQLPKLEKPSSLHAGNGGGIFLGPTGSLVPIRGKNEESRVQGIQGKQIDGSTLPMRFLSGSFTRNCLHCTHSQIPFVLPHPSSLHTLQKSLPLTRSQYLVLCLKNETSSHGLSKCRPFCKDAYLMRSGSEVESDTEDEVFVNAYAKSETDQRELERVCKVIDETFAIDRNMEAVLDGCGVNLSHELVLAVLERYKQARKPAFRFFCWATTRPNFDHNSRTYNAMMSILGKTRQFETMLSLLEEVGEKGLLTIETFTICIKVFAAAKERKKAVGIIDLMKQYNFKVDVEIINCLLDALGWAKLGKEAHVLFEKLEHKFTPNLRTYTILLSAWLRVKNLMEAARTWNEMIDKGFRPDIVAHNTMLEGLMRSRRRSDAIKLFEVMKSKGPLPNVRSYMILILDLCKQSQMNLAVDYLDEMVTSGFEPDAAIYTCLMMGFGNQNKMDVVYRILKEMREKGYPPDGQTYNALIKMMANRRMPDDAVKIYKKMIKSGIHPSIHTYNMIMKAYFVVKNYEMGCAVWEEMKVKGVCPDENSYIVMIGSLIRLERSSEACKYWEEMMEKGMNAPQLDSSKFRVYFSRTERSRSSCKR